MAGDELQQVAPVHADVGEGAGRSAQGGVDAPVVVLRAGQPVLQVGAVQQPHRAGRAVGDPGPGLPHRGVEAVDERDGGHHARGGGQRGELGGVGRVGGQRLLADHVHPGGEGCPHEAGVGGVGGADVDDVDLVEQLLQRAGPRGAQPLGGGPGGLRGRGEDGGELGAAAGDRAGVDGGHEATADDAGADPVGHGCLLSVRGRAGTRRPGPGRRGGGVVRGQPAAASRWRSARRAAWRSGSGTGAASSSLRV